MRIAIRRLASHPGFTIAAVFTLTIGLGTTAAIFNVVNGVILRPLPYADPGALVQMWERLPHYENASVAYPNFEDWRDQNNVFESLSAFRPVTWTLTGDGEPVELSAYQVSTSLFRTLGVEPLIGRAFLPEEDRREGPLVAVISHALWSARFGGDANVLGKDLIVNGWPVRVVGIMPPSFAFPPSDRQVSMWAPIEPFRDDSWSRSHHNAIEVIGRLKAGVSLEQARQEMDVIARRLEEAYPDTNSGSRVNLATATERALQGTREPLQYLLAASGLVLLITCLNVVTLLVARATLRSREMAVRAALGASARRLLSLLMTETFLLWILGGLGGAACAWLTSRLLATWLEGTLPRADQISCDLIVVGFSLGVAVVTAALFGLIPGLRGARSDPMSELKEGWRGVVRAGRSPLRRGLVVAQVTLATVLVGVTALTVHSYLALSRAHPGLDVDDLLVVRISLPESRYPELRARHGFFNSLLERVRAMPGVASAAVGGPVALAPGGWQQAYWIEGEPPPEPNRRPITEVCAASPDYHRTLGIPVRRGRTFGEGDGPDDRLVVVDETLAERHWPGQDPIGRGVLLGGRRWEVVGVVGHVKNRGVASGSLPQIYVPFESDDDETWSLVVRSQNDPQTLTEAVRKAVLDLDPAQPLSAVGTMRSYFERTTSLARFLGTLLGIFAVIALLLAGVAVYGVMAGETNERRHEIAVRMALGAGVATVLRGVLRQGLRMAAVGVLLGLFLFYGIARLIASQLYGVLPADPASLVLTATCMLAVTTVATLLPARRAAHRDPLEALRTE